MKIRQASVGGFLVAMLLGADTAYAHMLDGSMGGLLDGLWHPIGGLDHVLAMIGVGVWSGQLGARARWCLPATFLVLMTAGALAGALTGPSALVENAILVSAFAVGAFVSLRARCSTGLAVVAVSAFAFVHGHAHGAEVSAGATWGWYGLGFLGSTALLHGLGLLAWSSFGDRFSERALPTSSTATSAGVRLMGRP